MVLDAIPVEKRERAQTLMAEMGLYDPASDSRATDSGRIQGSVPCVLPFVRASR